MTAEDATTETLLDRARKLGMTGGTLCALQRIRAAVDPALVGQIDELIGAIDIPHTVVAKVINEAMAEHKLPHRLSDGIIGHHRQGRCTRCLS